jgi:hypothetical protein
MHLTKIVSGFVALASLSLAGAASAASTPSSVYVRNVSFAGSGCPAGSVAMNVSSDRQALEVVFDSFVASRGNGYPLSESRKNCLINLDLGYPSGWQYTVASLDIRGYVQLDRGATAVENDQFYFQGQTSRASLSTTFRGPISQSYQVRDTLGASSQVWSPCGANRALNINLQAYVSGGSGLITIESPLNLTNSFRIQWRRC